MVVSSDSSVRCVDANCLGSISPQVRRRKEGGPEYHQCLRSQPPISFWLVVSLAYFFCVAASKRSINILDMRSSPEELIAEAEQEVLAEYARTAQCLDSVGLLFRSTRRVFLLTLWF